jgi:hypothetical protein
MRSTEWESLKRNVQFAEESLRRWITKVNIAVPVALEKPIRNSKGVSKTTILRYSLITSGLLMEDSTFFLEE